MKTKIIVGKLINLSENHYIFVDDSDMLNCKVYDFNREEIVESIFYNKQETHCKKITHSTKPLDKDINGFSYWTKDIIPLSISEVEEAINGYSTYELFKKIDGTCEEGGYEHWLFKQGFLAHKKLLKKKLTLDIDAFKSIAYSFFSLHRTNEFSDEELELEFQRILNNNIQSLLPKTEWECIIDKQGKLKIV